MHLIIIHQGKSFAVFLNNKKKRTLQQARLHASQEKIFKLLKITNNPFLPIKILIRLSSDHFYMIRLSNFNVYSYHMHPKNGVLKSFSFITHMKVGLL